MVLGASELTGSGVRLQQAMDGFRLQAGAVRQPLGGSPGWGTERDPNLFGDQDPQDRVDQRSLADARPACDHQHPAVQRQLHRLPLALCERQA